MSKNNVPDGVRMKIGELSDEGYGLEMPDVRSNWQGRAKNRRVEIYITANEDMVKAIEAGTLK